MLIYAEKGELLALGVLFSWIDPDTSYCYQWSEGIRVQPKQLSYRNKPFQQLRQHYFDLIDLIIEIENTRDW